MYGREISFVASSTVLWGWVGDFLGFKEKSELDACLQTRGCLQVEIDAGLPADVKEGGAWCHGTTGVPACRCTGARHRSVSLASFGYSDGGCFLMSEAPL